MTDVSICRKERGPAAQPLCQSAIFPRLIFHGDDLLINPSSRRIAVSRSTETNMLFVSIAHVC
jgi:hypothetical protein